MIPDFIMSSIHAAGVQVSIPLKSPLIIAPKINGIIYGQQEGNIS